MGYTHYWRRKPVLEQEKFAQWAEDVRQLAGMCDKREIAICGGDGTGLGQFGAEIVCFNGDESKNEDYETFSIERTYHPYASYDTPENGLYHDFCKTGERPYDLLVTAALLRFRYYFPESLVSSDGSRDDWMPAWKLYQVVFNEMPSLAFLRR
jgi:hypothetical protein